MRKGIAFLTDVEKRLQSKLVDEDPKKISAIIKHLNSRLFELMNEDDVHSIRLTGLGVIDENYRHLKRKHIDLTMVKSRNTKEDKLNDLIRKMENETDLKKSKHNGFPAFMHRKRFTKLTDEELENLQNE